jgi:hypothetical protein
MHIASPFPPLPPVQNPEHFSAEQDMPFFAAFRASLWRLLLHFQWFD